MDYLSQITMLKLRLPSEELLNKSRQELIGYELAKASPGAGWGYFPGMEHHEALFYPETIHLGETLQEMITSIKISGPDYYLSFIKQSQFEVTASFGGLHLDPDPSLKEDEEIQRILINLHQFPRQLQFACTNRFELASLGVIYDRHYYTRLQLPNSIETKVLEIPPRSGNEMYGLVFIASQTPHVGITNVHGHFVASFERKIRRMIVSV